MAGDASPCLPVFGGTNSGSIQLGRILGIRIGASPSWFLVLFLLIYLLSDYFDDYALAVAAAACFFGSLLAHEFGHALAARREGIATSGMDLWFFGGLAKLSREPRTPGEEFRVAAAGPAVTLAIIALCLGLGAVLGRTGDVVDAGRFQTPDVGAGIELLGWLGLINVFLLVFNLVPAFPLDGGRIARAAVWRRTGDRARATRFSGRLGQGFGFALMGLGVFLLFQDEALDGLYLVVLGWFIAQAARGAVLSSAFVERLDGVTAADLMDHEPVLVPGDADAQRTHDEFFLRYRWPSFSVVDGGGRLLGLLRSERVEDALDQGRAATAVRELLEPEDGLQRPRRHAAAVPARPRAAGPSRRPRGRRPRRAPGRRADGRAGPQGAGRQRRGARPLLSPALARARAHGEGRAPLPRPRISSGTPRRPRRSMPQHDVLILGAGLAGQRAALAAADAGATVAIMSKVHPVRSH